jgi:hypothetical protein
VGERFDDLQSEVRNLGRYLAELEELSESYRAFATTVTLSQASDQAAWRKLLKRPLKVIGPPPANLQETSGTSARAEPPEDVSPVVSIVPLASDESLLEDIRPRPIGVSLTIVAAKKKSLSAQNPNMWCRIVDAFQTSALNATNDDKRKHLVKLFSLSGEL